ncbi:MAG TPA: DNA mismatch repair endonuclease MutL [Aestuariivirgaceae bacterium]|nr:DNA mismatch repair endonuclease MutL [Aestuariivirgaceae bacterium]
MRIRRLPEGTVNRIAAGEVIERPASVVKELAENALDAGARRIDIVFADGGRSRIRVSDDGGGMGPDELELAVERHATSKLADDDLIRITSMGFRGEALASIGSVSRLRLASRVPGGDSAYEIRVEAGCTFEVRPAALAGGTDIEVRDLFFAVPARLKFLKSARAEAAEAAEVVRRLAMAHPDVGFSLNVDGRSLIDLAACGPEAFASRIGAVMGLEFLDNAVPIAARREGVELNGFAGLPGIARAQARGQALYVNGRPVRDRALAGAVRAAYGDLLMNGRHPAFVLFLACAPDEVDVNVHPAKAEVRFRDAGLVRGLLVGGVREALAAAGQRTATPLAGATARAFRPEPNGRAPAYNRDYSRAYNGGFGEAGAAFAGFDAPVAVAPAPAAPEALDCPLGAARAQVHDNYILAQTRDGLVIVDAHAAHERLVYERLKAARDRAGIATQPLLVPEVVDLDPAAAERLLANADDLAAAGLVIDGFGAGAVVVREVPAVLAGAAVADLLRDIADDLAELDQAKSLTDRLDRVLATVACHGAVRGGRRLVAEEMNALLREMEATPHSGQCNHGRPTFVELKLTDIERLFARR